MAERLILLVVLVGAALAALAIAIKNYNKVEKSPEMAALDKKYKVLFDEYAKERDSIITPLELALSNFELNRRNLSGEALKQGYKEAKENEKKLYAEYKRLDKKWEELRLAYYNEAAKIIGD